MGNNWVNLNIPGGTTDSRNVFGLLPNIEYHWQIRTHCNAAETETSEWTALTTFTPGCHHPDSSWVSATSSNGASLNWTPVPQTFGYEIKGRRLPNGVWGTITVGGGLTDNRNVFGLPSATSFEWTMRSICTQTGSVMSPYTPLQTFTTTTAARQGSGEIREFGEMPDFTFKLFPNPAIGVLNLEFSFSEVQQIEVTNLLGQVIHRFEIAEDQKQMTVNVAKWSEGLYHVHLVSEGKIISSKPLIVAKH